MNRRSFIGSLALAAVAGERTRVAPPSRGSPVPPAGTFNGIQMGPHTILDEGIERTLDLLAETAAINAVMPYSHAYNAALVKPLRDRADDGVPLTDNAGRRFRWCGCGATIATTRTRPCGTRSSTQATSTPAVTCSPSSSNRRGAAA